MAWLGKRKKPTLVDEEAERQYEEAAAHAARIAKAGPPLVLLVPDVAGVSSYRLHHLLDAAAGVEFIQSSLAPQKRAGIHAFWALQEEPDETERSQTDQGNEAMVLIRTSDGSNVVYVVSFVDIESAQSFARFEVKRGLSLGSILIYWAVAVTITETEGALNLTPETPPHFEPRRIARQPRASAPAPPAPGADQRKKQAEEKKRLQEELAEMQRRQAIAEQRRAQLEEKKRLQKELAEMQRRQAEGEEARNRRREAQEKRQTSADEPERLRAEAEEKQRLQAEAEELTQLKAEADALRKLQAETQEILRLQREAEAIRKQLAEAEEQTRYDAERSADAEETAGREAATAEREQRQAEAEERRRLQTELADVQRRQAEAEERHRQVEAQETQRRREIEESRQQAQAGEELAQPGARSEAVAVPVPGLEEGPAVASDLNREAESVPQVDARIEEDWPPLMPASISSRVSDAITPPPVPEQPSAPIDQPEPVSTADGAAVRPTDETGFEESLIDEITKENLTQPYSAVEAGPVAIDGDFEATRPAADVAEEFEVAIPPEFVRDEMAGPSSVGSAAGAAEQTAELEIAPPLEGDIGRSESAEEVAIAWVEQPDRQEIDEPPVVGGDAESEAIARYLRGEDSSRGPGVDVHHVYETAESEAKTTIVEEPFVTGDVWRDPQAGIPPEVDREAAATSRNGDSSHESGAVVVGAAPQAAVPPEVDSEIGAASLDSDPLESVAVGVGAAPREAQAGAAPEFDREVAAVSLNSDNRPENGVPEDAEPEDDLPAEVARLMGKRRWERRDSPFKGFDSPPGRF